MDLMYGDEAGTTRYASFTLVATTFPSTGVSGEIVAATHLPELTKVPAIYASPSVWYMPHNIPSNYLISGPSGLAWEMRALMATLSDGYHLRPAVCQGGTTWYVCGP